MAKRLCLKAHIFVHPMKFRHMYNSHEMSHRDGSDTRWLRHEGSNQNVGIKILYICLATDPVDVCNEGPIIPY